MKILIVQIGKIGDAVLTTPLINALSHSIPQARIHVLASPRGVAVFEGNPHIRAIIVYRKDPFGLVKCLAALRIRRYDWLIDPKDHFSREGTLLARLTRARQSIGFNQPGRDVYSHELPSQEENYNLHAVQRNCTPLSLLGVSTPSTIRPELFPNGRLTRKILDRYGPFKTKVILLNISAGDTCRLWEIEKWAVVAKWCLERDMRVMVSFHPSHKASARWLQRLCPMAQLFFSSSIKESIALMPHLHWVVTPDTSIVHIASAFNIPQVAFFPSVEWNLIKFRPLSETAAVIQPKEGRPVASIDVAEVLKALARIVEGTGRRD